MSTTSGWPLVRRVGYLLVALPYGGGVAFVFSQGVLLKICTVFFREVVCVGCVFVVFCVTFNQIYYYYNVKVSRRAACMQHDVTS